MEQSEVEKSCPSSEADGLTRNRSFKSKQLVRSQAIRESTSPPRTVSPFPPSPVYAGESEKHDASATERTDASDTSSHSDMCSVVGQCDGERKKQVEIQITSGAWEESSEQRLRTRRWLGHRHHSDSRDLLSYNPRVTCVCGACACPNCKGRRRAAACPTKQDSGVMCSEDCPDCFDTEHNGPNGDGGKKSSFEDDQVFYCRCPDRKEKPKTISLSRTDSEDKTEPTGQELVNFIKETLNKNPRDRTTLLRIEKELHALVNDTGRCIVRFPVMTSYGRMLVHRCAALFQLAHHLDHTNKNSVLVSKTGTSGGRLPCTSFRHWCTAAFPRSPPTRHDDTLAKSILKREGPAGSNGAGAAPRSKSLEQRERDYERVRRRIFSSDNCTQDETQWPWLNSGPVKLLTPDTGRNKLLKVQSLENRGGPETSSRGPVSKSHSFGGYAADPPHHRLLSRHGDLASSSWRLSPSSSGYKTLSLRSTDSVTPSPTEDVVGGCSPEPGSEAGTLVWAVTDLAAVPPGAVVIHPQTGRPLTNPDGSIYHFDPANPPILYDASSYAQMETKVDTNEKRRGKLEKQHSFIDSECDCQLEEYRKCCCDCRRHEPCQKCPSDKKTPLKEIKTSSIPNSPTKARYTQQSTPEPIKQIEKHETSQLESKQNFENHRSFESTNHKASPNKTESNQRIENQNTNPSPNQRSFESTNQRPYENHRFETTNQRASCESQRSYANRSFEAQKDRLKVSGQDIQGHNYVQGVRNDEIISPHSAPPYGQPELAEVQQMAQAKITPMPIQDPNIRPVSITNPGYPAVVPQPAYQYANHCRLEQPIQPPAIYQPVQEEHKITHPHPDNTFRIDPSYPYAAEFSAACGACADPATHHTRGYNVPYGQVEVPPVLPPYPVPNVLIQQPMQPYPQYQEALQWQPLQPPVPIASPAAPKLMVHELYPLMYPNVYPPYNIVYPQVIPQHYPICQPVYPMMEKPPEAQRRNSITRKRNSLPNSSRNTPQTPSEEKKYEKREEYSRQNSNDIAMTIQQIKEQMSLKERDKGVPREEWRRRNSGSGLLGSYPVNNINGRVMGRNSNDETQLSSAARAIVNSIRNMQAKSTYQDNRRFHEPREQRERPRPRYERPQHQPAPPLRPPYLLRQMSPGTWCRRSPGPIAPVLNPPRRPHPDSRNGRRQI